MVTAVKKKDFWDMPYVALSPHGNVKFGTWLGVTKIFAVLVLRAVAFMDFSL